MIDEHTWEMWDQGPFVIELHEDWETKNMTLYGTIEGSQYWETEFFGDTLKEAQEEAAERCITIFEEWAEEAKCIIK